MANEAIAYYDYLLLVPYILIFFLIARRFAKKHAETTNEFYWLLINWWIKMIAGILYAWMIVYYYKYGDPLGYKDRSDVLLDSILKNWENIKYVFLPSESFKSYLIASGYSDLPYFSDLPYYAESSFMTSRVSCVAAFFTFNRFLLISFVFTNMAYYGFVIIYTASKKIIKGYNKQLALSCLFIPSCIFWSSGLAKEPICILCLGVLFSYTVKWLVQKKINFGQILVFIFFGSVLFIVKNYIFLCFAFAAFVWIFYNRFRKLMLKSALIMVAAIITLIATTSAMIYFFSNSISQIISENIGTIIDSNINMYESMATLRGSGSLIDVTDIDVSSVEGILKFIPQGLVNVFFRPFPWEISNALMVFTVLENLFFIYLLIKVFIRSRIFTKKLFINKNYQVFAIVFSITFALVVGISTFNFGTMVRYKMPFLPFWASFLLIINKKLSNNRKTVDL